MTKDSKVVVVTGAGSGIGAATARLFSTRGYSVVLTGRNREKLEAVAASISGPTRVIPADLRQRQEVQWLSHEIKKEVGPIHTLINNAGVFEGQSFESTNDDLWLKMFEVNFLGPVRLTRELVPEMKLRKQGVIINVSSSAGLRPVPNMIAYSTMKAALNHLTQSLALELAPFNIRVNCVCPGIVDTPIHQLEMKTELENVETRNAWASMHPLGRVGTADDVAQSIFALASVDSNWITGAILPVDGGISLL